ncbi:MAG: PDZ domain-containing protein [Candidatus Cloacimonadales bacterium]
MKKVILFTLILLSVGLYAQSENTREDVAKEIEMAQEEIAAAQQEIDATMQEVRKVSDIKIDINLDKNDSNSAFMGLTSSDLSLDKMQELEYQEFYGVLITGVSSDTPADFFRLAKDDIIMQIDQYQVKNSKEFSRILRLYRAGDSATLKIHRFGKVMELDFIFGSRSTRFIEEKNQITLVEKSAGTSSEKSKKKLRGGVGGGSWIPVWFNADFTDVNDLLAANNMDELSELEMFDKTGIILHGGGGKGNVGKDWMLGGMGAGYTHETSQKTANNEIRKVTIDIGYAGVTLDKRYAFTEKFVVAGGFMLGVGHQSVKISQTDGEFVWDFDDTEAVSNSSVLDMRKDYFVFQPKAVAMYRILDWLAIRAEGGYVMSHPFYTGWRTESGDNDYTVQDSPNSPFEGLTLTIGPWFGF